ncbi:MAG: hypothetical protein R3F30_07455 [Planctomycetota bacterium]
MHGEVGRDAVELWRGRLRGPRAVVSDDPVLLRLEVEGVAMRTRLGGVEHWCDRRLLARIHRYTIERLRQEIEPVSAGTFLRFLARWQHVAPEDRLHGPRGVAEVLAQLAGFEAPAAAWESFVIPARVRGYRREWLDELTLSGELAWGRLWGSGQGAVRNTPVALVPREDLADWERLAEAPSLDKLSAATRLVLEAVGKRGALFPADIRRATRLLPAQLEAGLGEAISRGLLTCDSYGGLRRLLVPASRRKGRMNLIGRWSPFREPGPAGALWSRPDAPPPEPRGRTLPGLPHLDEGDAEFVARRLLARWGVVFRKVLLRERQPIPWRELLRVYRRLELRGEARGSRFVAGFDGERYALPEAVRELRRERRRKDGAEVEVSAADLNLHGILTPEPRVSPKSARRQVVIGGDGED